MKIAYLYTAITEMGGLDRILSVKANYLAEQAGHEVYIITDSQDGRPTSFPISPKVHHIDLGINFGVQYRHSVFLRFFIYQHLIHRYKKALSRLLHQLHPDIVISTMGRDMDFLTSIHDGSIKMAESHIAKPFCRNLHLMEQKGGLYRLMAHHYQRKMERFVAKLHSFIVLTEDDALFWAPIKQAVVIGNPCPITPLPSPSAPQKVVVSVGRLNEQKGYDLLLKAWKMVTARHPDWQLNIYGVGLLHDALEQTIQQTGISHTAHLLNYQKDVRHCYDGASFYVMSSRFEGFGLVLIEAMTCGLPCVSFNCPSGPSTIIHPHQNGLLVENGNIPALADAICYMMEHPEERAQMAHQALVDSNDYALPQVMKKWLQLFDAAKK